MENIEQFHAQGEYSQALQRLIETHGRGEFIPPELAEKSPHLAEQLGKIYSAMSQAIHTLAIPGYGQVGGIDVQLVDMAQRGKVKLDECEGELERLREENTKLHNILVEVYCTIPSTYDPHDRMVKRHAAALNALGPYLKESITKAAEEGLSQ